MTRLTLMTADAVGGVWTYATELAAALGQQGWRTALAVLGPPPSAAQRAEASRLPGVTLYEWHGRLEWMDDPWADVAASGDWLLDLAHRLRPDVVHLNGYSHGGLPFGAPVVVVGHSCVRSWWRDVKGAEPPSAVDWYTDAVRAGVHAADLVVAPSGAMLASLQREYGPLERTSVIPNGRSSGAIAVPKEPFVFTAGRLWDEAKNVAAVCGVAPRLPWPVYLAGDRAHARFEGEECVRMLGRLAPGEVAAWMARASIYALPARYEPFGLSALEAALAGCALVLGDIASLREIWGQAALFVPPDDRDALCAAMTRLATDTVLLDEMSARARARARIFTPRKMAAEYIDAYRWALDRRASAADPSRASAGHTLQTRHAALSHTGIVPPRAAL